ncbi:MAG: metal-dependent transcriptional regulator [Propioniciclava sp.]|uniref:metal-dependent transcriptional regulator n=1 Tax=Propioniciclava sp. TaxID=2038686 RepID=UPI0039E4B3F3
MAESAVTENYLKAVWNAAEWSERPVTVTVLASRLGLAPSSVSESVRKLTERGLLTHARYGAIELTPEGRRIALAIVRKHRLIETFLVDYLGYGWDEVHDEAEVLEHSVSDLFIDRLDARLGHPDADPHGDPIPAADGHLPAAGYVTLDTVDAGTRVQIVRVADSDPDLLRHLEGLGLTPGAVVEVAGNSESTGVVDLSNSGAAAALSREVARSVRVHLC